MMNDYCVFFLVFFIYGILIFIFLDNVEDPWNGGE